jgi:hypothetical protein
MGGSGGLHDISKLGQELKSGIIRRKQANPTAYKIMMVQVQMIERDDWLADYHMHHAINFRCSTD